MRKSPIQFRCGRRGVAAVETALLLPLFLMMLLGIFEFGRAFMVEHVLASASRLGVRRAIVEGATESQVTTLVKDFCTDNLGVAADSVTVVVSTSGGGGLSNAEQGDVCTVTVSIPFEDAQFVAGNFLPGSSLSASCTMEHE